MADINKLVNILFDVKAIGANKLDEIIVRAERLNAILKQPTGIGLDKVLQQSVRLDGSIGGLEQTAASSTSQMLALGVAGTSAFSDIEKQASLSIKSQERISELFATVRDVSKPETRLKDSAKDMANLIKPISQLQQINTQAMAVTANINQLRLALFSLNDATNTINSAPFKEISTQMRGEKFEGINRALNPKNIDTIKNSVMGLNAQFKQMSHLDKELSQIGKAFNKQTKLTRDFEKQQQAKTKAIKDTTRESVSQRTNMAMNFLSILFVGQMVERFFKQLAITTLSTFMKIADSTNTAKQSVILLSASWEYLKFTVGNAIATVLEPLIPTIVRVVEVIADWIQQHPKLTAGLITAGVGLGVFMSTLGNMWLLVASLVNIYELLAIKSLLVAASSKTAGVGLAIAGAGGKAAKTGFMAALIGINPLIVGLLLLGIAAIASILSFEGLREINAEIFTGLWPSIEGTKNRLLKVFGVNIELGDTFRYLGAIATWLFAGFANGLSVVITTFGILATIVIDFGKLVLSFIIHQFGNVIDAAILLGKVLNVVLPSNWEIDVTPFESMKQEIDNTVASLVKSVGTDLKHLFDITPEEKAAFDERSKLIAMGPSGIFEESKRRELQTFKSTEEQKTAFLNESLKKQQSLLSLAQPKTTALLSNALKEQTKQPFNQTQVLTSPLNGMADNLLIAKTSVDSLFDEDLLKSIQENYNAPLKDSELLTSSLTEKLSLLNGAIGGEEESLIPTMTTLNLANDTFISNLNEAIPLSVDHTAKMNLESEAARKLRIESDSAATALERLNKARERALVLQAGGTTQTVRTIKNSSTFKSTAQGNK